MLQTRAVRWLVLTLLASLPATDILAVDGSPIVSHPPMRPLPAASSRPLGQGPSWFVDPVKGDDRQPGSQAQPWKTVNQALSQLKPGDTLYLRAGQYYESVTVAVSGTAEKPITVRAYPGELAILDAGWREFFESPARAWEPFPQGAKDEYRSTTAYAHGGGFGNFGDSMVPLHRYLTFSDLRSTNELWHEGLAGRANDPKGIYAGPGVRRDPDTGRIHIRLAHTQLAGLGANHYRGETDPRKLPLVIAGQDYALQVKGAKHVRLQDLVVRGAQRSAVTMTNAADVELDGMTLYGSGSALRVHAIEGLRLLNCGLRGHAAPWHSRAHHKYRAGSGYLFFGDGSNFEFAQCSFTDHHDGLLLHGVAGMRLHHCQIDNFNDDGVEPGPQKERGQTFIYQNLISRCLSTFTLHGKKPHPVKTDAGSGVYIYRNIVDLRQGTYRAPPQSPDPSGRFLNSPSTMVAHDHGSPTWPNYYVYQNTFLLPGNSFHNIYAFHFGAGSKGTRRRVFNNIFVQVEGIPGTVITAKADEDFQADGNLLWGITDGPKVSGDVLAKFRRSPLFEASKKQYPPGWGANDRFADPRFVSVDGQGDRPPDLRLQKDSPAVGAGVALPAEWPDPLRKTGGGKPDIGAFPLGAEPLRVGPTRPVQEP